MAEKGLVRTLVDSLGQERIRPVPPPTQFEDGRGREIEIRRYRTCDFESIVSMYEDFDSTDRAQGTPPIGSEAIRSWLGELTAGVNVVAWNGDRAVGHICLVPDGTDRHELAIFVHQDHQRSGIGTQLMAAGLAEGERNGVEYVWLSVERSSGELQSFYSRAGFSVVNPMGVSYRMSRYLRGDEPTD